MSKQVVGISPPPLGGMGLAGLIALAFGLSFGLYLLQGDALFGLMDEGYLWYGGWRTSLGEVPVRDFESYDPGRYYWTALWLAAFGNSLDVLRLATAAFQGIGLVFGLLVMRRIRASWWLLVPAGVLLCIWMYPRYKPFEPVITLAAIWFAVRLLERPSVGRHFAGGVFVGLAAWLGRNHGLYNLVAFVLLYGFALWKIDRSSPWPKLLAAGGGILVGYLPMLYAIAFQPGFLDAFVESLAGHFRLGTTNVPHTIPWPWLVWKEGVGTVGVIVTLRSSEFLMGVIYVLYPIALIASALFLATRRATLGAPERLLAAATAVALAYLHYAMARPIFDYVAMSLAPLLILLMAVPSLLRKPRWLQPLVAGALAVGLAVVTWYTAGKASYLYKKVNIPDLEPVEITGDRVWVKPEDAAVVRALDRLRKDILVPGDSIVVLPFWPAAYVILDRPSPIWDIYMHFARSEEQQRGIVAELTGKRVRWAIVGDVQLEGDDAWRMKNRNPIVWDYFQREFAEVELGGLPGNYKLLKRK
jgi:hypothetical protein